MFKMSHYIYNLMDYNETLMRELYAIYNCVERTSIVSKKSVGI